MKKNHQLFNQSKPVEKAWWVVRAMFNKIALKKEVEREILISIDIFEKRI